MKNKREIERERGIKRGGRMREWGRVFGKASKFVNIFPFLS